MCEVERAHQPPNYSESQRSLQCCTFFQLLMGLPTGLRRSQCFAGTVSRAGFAGSALDPREPVVRNADASMALAEDRIRSIIESILMTSPDPVPTHRLVEVVLIEDADDRGCDGESRHQIAADRAL